jgi:hypothetical protein
MEAGVGTRTLTFDLPDDLVERLGSSEEAAARAKEALVLQLLREGEISQGSAAELLGLNRWEIIDLMSRHEIPSGPSTEAEYDRDLEVGRRYVRESRPGASRQQQ